MADEPNFKTRAWAIFDRIVADAAGDSSNPWIRRGDGSHIYLPDFKVLEQLLGVPLFLKAGPRTGVPALALDIWVAHELRRAGFDRDAVWPRAEHPRVMPAPIVNLLKALPAKERQQITERLSKSPPPPGTTASSASILGKNYYKQVDVVMSDWATGPELLISTKRMDSSYGNNTANRVEESYGDAKNLRLRHPLAALGFVFGLRTDVLDKSRDIYERLVDLLAKLGQEDDAYHAVGLLMMEYSVDFAVDDASDEPEESVAVVGVGVEDAAVPKSDGIDPTLAVSLDEVESALAALPRVTIRRDETPADLDPGRFMAIMVRRVLDAAPINYHRHARIRMQEAPQL